MTKIKSKKLTKKQREQDELVLAEIVQNAAARPDMVVLPAVGHDDVVGSMNGFGTGPGRIDGPVCAVGAGLLFAGVPLREIRNPIHSFAKHYGVPTQYALYVSNGFEGRIKNRYSPSTDEARGMAVGVAAFQALCADKAKP